MADFTQLQIDTLKAGAQAALSALNSAYRAQALAETVPLAGATLDEAGAGATDVAQNLRLALAEALATFSGAATYTVAAVEAAVEDAIRDRGITGVSVNASADAGGATLTFSGQGAGTATVDLPVDLALPGLALEVQGTVDLTAAASFALTMGLDGSGYYLLTGAGQGIDLSVDGGNVTLVPGGSFGPLSYALTDQGSTVALDFDIRLTDADGKLRLSELSSDFLTVTVDGAADFRLGLEADFGTAALPSVSAALVVDWDFAGATVDPTDQNQSFGSRPTVTLADVTLDLGSFLDDVVLPVFDAIAPVLGPIRIALDVLTSDISMLKLLPDWETLLDKTGDGKVNLLDLLKLANPSIDLTAVESFLDLAADILAWSDFLGSVDLGAADLIFGDFELAPGQDIRSLAFDLANATANIGTLTSTLQDTIETLTGSAWDTGGRDILAELASGTGFRLPILEDPAQIISLLFGGDADLIQIDFPKIDLSAGSETLIQIPVFPGINVAIGGMVSAVFDLAFGYDTRGLTQPGGSLATALNGLYLLDGPGAEITLEAAINLGVNLDVLLASIYGGGDIKGTILLDLADDLQSVVGRLYYDEFIAALTTNPFSIFDASGAITGGLSLAVRVLGADIFRLDSPRVTLADFNFTDRQDLPSDTAPLGLATQAGGDLTLNIGALAGGRTVGGTTDGPEIVNLSEGLGGTVWVSVDGYAEGFDGVTRVIGDAGAGNDQIALAATLAVEALLSGGEGADLLAGGSLDDTLSGDGGNDTLFGREGDDDLQGGMGDDLFIGGDGADTMAGGGGAEDMVSYAYSSAGVTVDLGLGTGAGGEAEGDQLSDIDVLQGSRQADSLTGAAADEMIVGLEGNDSLVGGGGADVLLGSVGDDLIDGGLGADLLVGAAGNDTYHVDDLGDVVDENRYGELLPGDDPGIDEVVATLDWTLSTATQGDIEHLTLVGAARHGIGNALANRVTAHATEGGWLEGLAGNDSLIGGTGQDVLDGGTGADSLSGGAGNDTYLIDNTLDVIDEGADAGTDTAIVSLSSYTLADAADIQILALAASVNGGLLIGNGLDQLVIGAAGNDTLEGRAGADALSGGAGIDRASYRNSIAGVVIDLGLVVQVGGEAEGDSFADIEEVEGSAHDDRLTGAALADVLHGLDGNDSLAGMDSTDTLYGGDGADTLDGGLGADRLVGADGDDLYRVDDASDVVSETATGADTVEAALDWSLDVTGQQAVEALWLTGTARRGTGNALANLITGTTGDDTLEGRGGADTLQAGAGDDVYILDSAADEADDTSGHDRIDLTTALTGFYDMAVTAAGVEDLAVLNSIRAVTIRGNDLDNQITGNGNSDALYGAAGNDTLIAGGGGVEALYGGSEDDDLSLLLASRGAHMLDGGTGDDTLRVDWSETTANVNRSSSGELTFYSTSVPVFGEIVLQYSSFEAFDLRSGSGSDSLFGGDRDDTLYGGAGSDRLYAYRGMADLQGGTGHDFALATILTAENIDLGLDFTLRLIDTQIGPVTVNGGTAVETIWQGIEQAQLVTGAGDDTYDTRGVASSWNTFNLSHYFNSGAGDDTYATDLLSLGFANFVAGEGYDRLIIDWSDTTANTTREVSGTDVYYRTSVPFFGEVLQYFSDIEEIDLQTGSGSDQVYAVGGRDRFRVGGNNDRVFGLDRGDTLDAGAGQDWAELDLRGDAGDVDEDIRLNLAENQTTEAVYFAGTEDETRIQGLERIHLYTGSGDDTYDTRGVASSWNTFNLSHYFNSGAGDDTYATDLQSLGFANFVAGEGYDRLIIDWSGTTANTTREVNGTDVYYRTSVPFFGEVLQYFSDIEEIDLQTGSGSDQVYAVGGRDRFRVGGNNDRVFGLDRGDTLDAGAGLDWAELDLRGDAGDADEDIRLNLAENQTTEAVYFAGTEDETRIQGLERIHLYTGAGDDTYDTRGVASSWNTFNLSHYFNSGAGDDTYATDLLSLGFANFVAGEGYDRLIIDWSGTTANTTREVNGTDVYYRTSVPFFGEVLQYFSDIEEIDLQTGSGSDQVYAVGGRDRFRVGGNNDRVFGLDRGDTLDAGAGQDWAELDLRGDAGDVDEDIRLNLAENQTTEAVYFAGTEDETRIQGLERIHLYTGAGDDTYDTRGVASSWNTFNLSHYFNSGAGDDTYATDLLSLGFANFVAGEGYDRLIIDWSGTTANTTREVNGTDVYYRTSVPFFGEVLQYFSDIEEIDLQTGSGSDQVYAVGGRDRFRVGGNNDRVFGLDRGDTLDAGAGLDWAELDLRGDAGDVDEDIRLNLAENQTTEAVYFAGTEDETRIQGLERIHLYTGSGDDTYDTRGVASSWNTFNLSHYFNSGAGDDTYATDLLSLGFANFVAGEGYDRLIIDWSGTTANTTREVSGTDVYYRTSVPFFGEVLQYFSDIEEIDLQTGSGSDQVYAVGGRDRFRVGGNNDRVFGLDRGDTLDAGAGLDWAELDLRGDAGDVDEDIRLNLAENQTTEAVYFAGTEDETRIQGLERIHLYTGSGDDTYDTRGVASSWNTFNLSHYFNSGAGDDTYATDLLSLGFANFVAGEGYDRLIIDWSGTTGVVNLITSGGSSYYSTSVPFFGEVQQHFSGVEAFSLFGGSANDQLVGGTGDDVLSGGAGRDTLTGGDGDDRVDYAHSTAVQVDLTFQTATGGDATGDVISGIEDVSGSLFADFLTGSAVANRLTGRGGADTLQGGDGDDRFTSGAGADVVSGGAGVDIAAYRDSRTGVWVDLVSLVASGGSALGDQLSGIEGLIGSDHSDRLLGDGLDNALKGGSGNDELDGRDGLDLLSGEDGDDVLSGGAGNDTLTGGTGADFFVFAAGLGRDRVWDFSMMDGDRLQLGASLGLSGLTGAEIVDQFGTLNAGQTILRFSAVERITLQGVTDLIALAASIDVL